MEQTLGERLVRTAFNPSSSGTVDGLKQKTAELINLVDQLRYKDERTVDLAVKAYEEACMWAVKAATTPSVPLPSH